MNKKTNDEAIAREVAHQLNAKDSEKRVKIGKLFKGKKPFDEEELKQHGKRYRRNIFKKILKCARQRNHTSFSLPKPLGLWVNAQAKKAGKSRSAWIVWLLEREKDLMLTVRMSELEKRVSYLERPFKDLPTNIHNR